MNVFTLPKCIMQRDGMRLVGENKTRTSSVNFLPRHKWVSPCKNIYICCQMFMNMTAGSFDLLACVACVWKGRGKEDRARGRREKSHAFPSLLPRAYFVLHTRPKPLPFRTPATQALYLSIVFSTHLNTRWIDGLQSRDESVMLVDKTIANYGSYFA